MRRWLFLALWLLVGAALAQDRPPGGHGEDLLEHFDKASGSFVSAMEAGMGRMMRDMHAPGYTGNPDIDFLAMMIPHHEGAVEMARLALVHGRDPLTRQLAEEIIASQLVEIEGMKRRLAILRTSPHPDESEFPALKGTRGTGR